MFLFVYHRLVGFGAAAFVSHAEADEPQNAIANAGKLSLVAERE
jgi:hypothetical protein